jgi:hypothetical protein
MNLQTELLRLPIRRGATAAITGTRLAGPPPWQSTVGGDAMYAIDPATGEHQDVDSIYGTYHGVLVQWLGINFAEGFVVAWCPCHADHPVVVAAREGRFVSPQMAGELAS